MREFALSVLLSVAALCVQAAEPIVKFGVVLLQPGTVLEDRVPSVDAMAEYIKSIEAASREAVLASASKQSSGGFIVVAVRPGQKSKVWLDFDTLLDADMSRQIVSRVTQVRPFEARKGPVVFAIKVALWDGRETRRVAPSPTEWKAATKQAGRPLDIDSMIQRVWREPDA
ncbi:MAG TPA: hypothetical protein VGJ35_04090 [Burkholderiaceae bacterium]|jgi:hypothetical protein